MMIMKSFLSSYLVVASLVLLLSYHPALGDTTTSECIGGDGSVIDPTKDYFPNKVTAEHSKNWKVEYYNTYKIATNIFRNETYLLYQCGSTPPPMTAEQKKQYNAVLEIPLQSVGITVTPMINFLEQLASLDKVKYYLTSVSYISSPCFKGRVESGEIQTADDIQPKPSDQIPLGGGDDESSSTTIIDEIMTTESEFVMKPDRKPIIIEDSVLFADGFQDPTLPFNNTVLFSSYTEKTNKAIFEWVKFYSVFFNHEEYANRVTKAASDRYECVSRIADETTSDGPRPVALWGSYSSWCGGWMAAKCADGGNFYCEMADKCDTDIISDQIGTLNNPDCGTLLTTEEWVEYGKDADHWFYTTHYDSWEDTYNNNKELLDTMQSVQNQQVYDYQGSGSNAWFQERTAEYYDVLQDFCHTVGTSPKLENRPTWFRNVFTEPIGDPGICEPGKTIDREPFQFDGVCETIMKEQGGMETTTTTTTETEAKETEKEEEKETEKENETETSESKDDDIDNSKESAAASSSTFFIIQVVLSVAATAIVFIY